MLSKAEVDEIKRMYPQGMKIRLIEMQGEPQMPDGLEGKVKMVDDAGQIHGVYGDPVGKKTGYGIVTGTGRMTNIRRTVRQGVRKTMGIGKTMENTRMTAGGSLSRIIIRRLCLQQ